MADLPYPTRFTYGPPVGFEPRSWAREAEEDYGGRFKALRPDQQLIYRVYAGTGAGKTNFAASVAAWTLNQKQPRQVTRIVYVCPNLLIADAVKQRFRDFGICLARWMNKEHATAGEGRLMQGCVMTYHSLANCAAVQRRFLSDTLVIFDEFHHLGDELAWGTAAVEAFANRPECLILMLSGTPFRSDDNEIPFAEYYYDPPGSTLRRFRCHFSYTYGQAILAGHCRRPVFPWRNIEIPTAEGARRFIPDMPSAEANELLRLAVRHDSPARMELLSQAYSLCREEGRRAIVFLGGDSRSDRIPTFDANKILPGQLQKVGFADNEIAVVTSSDRKEARDRINAFNEGKGTVLVSVNMVSEGVDIPTLSLAVLLTSITAPNTLAQRIGRVARGTGYCPILAFRHPAIEQFARELDREIQHAIDVSSGAARTREPGKGRVLSETLPPSPLAQAIRCFPDGHTVNQVTYSQAQRERVVAYLRDRRHYVREEDVSLLLEAFYGPGEGRPA